MLVPPIKMGWEEKKGLKERHLGYLYNSSLEGSMDVVKMVMIMTETSRKAKHRTLRMEGK